MITSLGLEQEMFKSFLEKKFSNYNSDDSLQKFRRKSWDRFLELGLPTHQTEVYRYIKLRHLFSQSYELANEKNISLEQITPFIYPECSTSVLVFVNGHYRPQLSSLFGLPAKLTISTLQEAMRTYGAFLNNLWAKSLREEKDSFATINSALQQNGVFIYIPPKVKVDVPLQILHLIQTDENLLMLTPRINIFVGSQSEIEVVSSQKILSSHPYFVNQLTEIALEEDSHVHYTQALCDENPSSWHLDAIRSTLKRNATLKTIALTKGSSTVRHDYRVVLAGDNAEALLNGIWMLSDKREAHVNVYIEHQSPYCRSYQLFKGVLNDFSRSSFEGKIMVRQLAQKTEAFQLNNNLILKDHAHADSKPNLEIFADDVKASHGSTFGPLEEEQLFYMVTRGIPEAEAKKLLIYGFCKQVVDLISLPSLKEEMTQYAQQYYNAE